MKVSDINVLIFEGDTVIDRMDGTRREIQFFHIHDERDASVYMVDGGVMGLNEIRFDDIQIG